MDKARPPGRALPAQRGRGRGPSWRAVGRPARPGPAPPCQWLRPRPAPGGAAAPRADAGASARHPLTQPPPLSPPSPSPQDELGCVDEYLSLRTPIPHLWPFNK
jgi:hypothetical protein